MNAPAPVLQAEALTRHYRVRRGWFGPAAAVRALAGISFTLAAGRTLAVVGESGCGKTTLARLVTLIEPASSGSLVIDGLDAAAPNRAIVSELRRKVQIVFQDPYGSLNPRKTLGGIIEEPLAINTTLDATSRRQRAHEVMVRVGLRPPSTTDATRTCFPAASGSARPSPVRW